MNFIKEKLINKIEKEVKKRQLSYTYTGFFFLNDPIKMGDTVIDRVSSNYLYGQEEIVPRRLSIFEGKILLDILTKIVNDEFYFYKIVNDRKYKIKMKKDDTLGSKYR